MRKAIGTLAVVAIAAGSVAGTVAQAHGVHYKYRHHYVVRHDVAPPQQSSGDINYFSSSSGLHVGVNHPPKNR
jgi:hypothetical protein